MIRYTCLLETGFPNTCHVSRTTAILSRLVSSVMAQNSTQPTFSLYDDPRSLDTFPNPCYSSGFTLELLVLQPVRLLRSIAQSRPRATWGNQQPPWRYPRVRPVVGTGW